jgi:hypothetical protein
MDKEVYMIRLDKWRKLIYEANTCGMKKTEWCRINGVSTKQFYYWQKRVRAQALEEIQDGTGMDGTVQGDGPAMQLPSFVELKPPTQSCYSYPCSANTPGDAPEAPLILNFKDCQLQIRGNASESVLRMVVKVLRDA